jgi:hypothetical protein
MRDRGESLRDIARMAGVGEKVVRDLIRAAGVNQANQSVGDAVAPTRDGVSAL